MPIYLYKKLLQKNQKRFYFLGDRDTYDFPKLSIFRILVVLSKWWTEINRKKIEFIYRYILSIKSKNGPPTDDELIEFTGWASLNYIASVVEKMGFLKRQGNFFCSTEIMFIVQATLDLNHTIITIKLLKVYFQKF